MGFRPAMPFVIRPTVYLPATQAYISSAQAAGSKVIDYRRGLYNDLFRGLYGTGLWETLDRLWALPADDSVAALIDLKALATAVATGGPTFTANSGFTGVEAGAQRITTDFTPSTAGGKYTQNSACIGIWNNTNGTSARASISGRVTGVTSYNSIAKFSDGNAYFRVNTATGASAANSGDARGLIMGNRSGANQVDGYKNGASIATTGASASAAVPDLPIVALANYSGDAAFDGAGIEISAIIIGGSLDAAGHENLYSVLRPFMTAVGVP